MAILAVDDVMLRGVSPYERLLARWRQLGATFLWGGYPNDRESWLVDRISGVRGTLNGGACIGNAGISRPDGTDDSIYFPTTAGCGARYLAAVLVNITNATDSGAFIKVGNDSTGLGLGMGSTGFDAAGTLELGLIEGVAWALTGATAPPTGLSVRYITARNAPGLNDVFCSSGAYRSSTTPLAPVGGIYINGYTAATIYPRYSANAVLAAAVFANAPVTSESLLNEFHASVTQAGAHLKGLKDLTGSVYW